MRKIVNDVLPQVYEHLEEQLVTSSTDSKTPELFKNSIEEYLNYHFSKSKIINTSKKQRKDKSNINHNYADIMFQSHYHGIMLINANACEKNILLMLMLQLNHRIMLYIQMTYSHALPGAF